MRGPHPLPPGVPEQLRGTYAGLAHPAVARAPAARSASPRVELLPVHAFVAEPAAGRSAAWRTTGATTRSASSPRTPPTPPRPTRRARSTSSRTWCRPLHAAGPRGDPRRRLQPHRRGRPGRPDPVAGAGSTTAAYYRLDGARQRRRRHRLRQHPRPARTRVVCGWSWTRCATGSSECTSTASASTSPPTLGPRPRRRLRPRPPVPRRAAHRPGAVAGQAHRRAVGRRRRTAGAPASSRRRSRSGTTASATACATSGCRRPQVGARRAAARRPRPGDPAGRLADLFAAAAAAPLASVNFVTAHDGFTLRDLVRLRPQAQRGQRRGQPRRHDDNRSWNHGVEGADRRPGRRSRRAGGTARNLLGTLLLVDRRADDHGRRRARPHPARQQQRLLPGQRDVLGRLGPRPEQARPARDHRAPARGCGATTRCCGSDASSPAARARDGGGADLRGSAPTARR